MSDQDLIAGAGNEEKDDSRRVPAVERVLDFILMEMDEGRLSPGSRVNAARIAAILGLSSAPVREALNMLAGRGVIDLLPDRGAIMRPLQPKDIVALWEVIAPLGAVGVDLAAKAIARGADARELVAKFNAICHEPLSVTPLAFILRLNTYHWCANTIGGNEYVSLALERLGIPYWDRYLIDWIDVHANIEGYLTNYRRMHAAIMAGDGAAAGAILHFHANWSINLIQKAVIESPRARRKRRIRALT